MGGTERPVRVAQCRAADLHGIRRTRFQYFLGLLRLGDESHRGGRDAGARPHLLGERHLIAGLHRNGHIGNQTAGGHVNQVHAMRLQNLGQIDGLIEIPATCGPVGGGDTNQKRHGLRNDGTDSVHNLDQHADAVFERATVFVVTPVDERVKELGQQITVRRMDFHRVEADIRCAPSGIAELSDDGVDLIDAQRARTRQRPIRVGARADRLPSPILPRHAPTLKTDRMAARGALASRMVELHGHRRSGGLHIGDNPTPCLHLRVVPQSQIAWRDAAFRRDGRRFHDDHAEAAHRARHVMLVVERRRPAVLRQRGIRVHRRQPDTVAHGHAAQRHRIEQPDRPVLLDIVVLLALAHRHLFLSNSKTIDLAPCFQRLAPMEPLEPITNGTTSLAL